MLTANEEVNTPRLLSTVVPRYLVITKMGLLGNRII